MNTIARIKQSGKNFEIIVDLDEALKFKKGEVSSIEPESDKIFRDSKKGTAASFDELEEAFGTKDFNSIAKKIVKNGEVLVTQEYRDEEREKRLKQIVDFLSRSAIDPRTGKPHPSERIKSAMEQAGVNIKNGPIESQIADILRAISSILPISVKMKKIKINIPAASSGKAYGIIAQYKEKEGWLNDGSLEVILNIPAGAVMDFYDKLNSITHGSALTEEIEE